MKIIVSVSEVLLKFFLIFLIVTKFYMCPANTDHVVKQRGLFFCYDSGCFLEQNTFPVTNSMGNSFSTVSLGETHSSHRSLQS